MTAETSVPPKKPLVNRSAGHANVWRLLALSAFLLVVAGALALWGHAAGGFAVLAIFGFLAAIGVLACFALALGFLQFSTRSADAGLAQDFMDNLPVGTLMTDERGRIIYANRAYGEATGMHSAQDARTFEQLLLREPEAAEATYRLSNLAREGGDGQEEFRLSRALSGKAQPTWYRVRVRALNSGARRLSVWEICDITDERTEQETFFQELQDAIDYLDHAPVGFFASDEVGSIVYLNGTLAGWLGLDLTALDAGKLAVADIVGAEGRALLQTAARAEAGRMRVVDVDMVTQSGKRLPVRLLQQAETASDDRLGRMRTVVLNLSARKEHEVDALEKAEIRFNRFFNSSPMAIASLNGAGHPVQANAAFARLFGETVADGTVALEKALRDESHEAIRGAMETAMQGRAGIPSLDVELAGEDSRSVRLYFSAVSDINGESDEAALVFGVDFTDQRALEEQFAKAQKMQAIGNLAGGIAHDFNNVLTIITASVDFLLLNHRSGDPSFQDLLLIKQSANRAASLVRQLLAYSRRQTMRPKMLNMTDVVADMHLLLRRISGDLVKLERHHARDLWPVMADIGQFEQVITNLVQNARDAMPDGGNIAISTRNVASAEVAGFGYPELTYGDYVLVEVADSGTGMPADVAERIFEPFFTTKEIGKGTGLGLSMVYGIIKQSGGFIFVDSRMGEGTTFRIFLPRHMPVEPAVAKVETTAETAHPGSKVDLSGTATILLVEDEDHVRAGNVRALKMRGYDVHEASSGIEALAVMEEIGGEVDLVVSDVMMPEMDGPTLLREMRKTRPELKFIFVSGYAEDAFAKNLPEGARFGFLAKPFSLRDLAVAVKDMLEE
ncbi:response regulator [Aureimonas fodinaquatilis]|uniref:histidine kinase n=1 Tax=Aureimonas fodinaquatilis TaxID=2565783 RepID=A0A5B0E5B3_9HYPH|nr:response regulator [Aureimonas fodinaquatilis]KAA0972629.1 response regulator [Aureimonas fodinaquatilis]